MSEQTTIEALEARLRKLEDQLAIYQLVATYGPSVDSLSQEAVGALWTEDGIYDAGGSAPMRGTAEIGNLVNGDLHQGYVAKGCAHVGSLPHLVLDGDTAVAANHTRVYTRNGDHWKVERASANRWELVRTPDGWRVKYRLNRPLDGTSGPRDILGRSFRG